MKIKEFCENNNYELTEIIEDFGISGTIADRKGYFELQSKTYKDADMIVISELSRLSRQEDVTEILILTIKAWAAAQERLEIKKKNQNGKQALFQEYPYAIVDQKTPYGYRQIPNPNGKRPDIFWKKFQKK